MNTKLCRRFGYVAGGSVGLFVGLLSCCISPPPISPTITQLSFYGLIVSLIFVLLAAAMVCLVKRLPIAPVFTLALLIAIVVGLLLGPVAYQIPNPGLALFLCAILGALLAWLICRILCRRGGFKLEASR